MADTIEYTPQDNIIKDSIAELVQPYTMLKKTFFMNATKEDDETAQEYAGRSYGPLLDHLYTLLDLSKPDNIEMLDKIGLVQTEITELDKVIQITATEINRIKLLCTWADTGPLLPHLKTQPNIGRVKPTHTRNYTNIK